MFSVRLALLKTGFQILHPIGFFFCVCVCGLPTASEKTGLIPFSKGHVNMYA